MPVAAFGLWRRVTARSCRQNPPHVIRKCRAQPHFKFCFAFWRFALIGTFALMLSAALLAASWRGANRRIVALWLAVCIIIIGGEFTRRFEVDAANEYRFCRAMSNKK